MNKIAYLLVILLIFCSCSISNSDRQMNEPIEVNPLIGTGEEYHLSYFSEEEIFDFPLLRSDWSKEQMEEVLSLFPNEKDWKTSEFGEFYGKVKETEEKEPFGSITVTSNGEIWLTLSPAGYGPFLRVFFTDDKVTHYTFYLNTPN